MKQHGNADPKFDMMQHTNLLGQVSMILCWYWGDEAGYKPQSDGDMLLQAVGLVPSFLAGEYGDFSKEDWWLLLDALGSYPNRTPILEELYEIAHAGYAGLLDLLDTKSFVQMKDDEKLDNAVMDSSDEDDDLPPYQPFSPSMN